MRYETNNRAMADTGRTIVRHERKGFANEGRGSHAVCEGDGPLTLTVFPLNRCHNSGGEATARFAVFFLIGCMVFAAGCGKQTTKATGSTSQLASLGLPPDTNINVKEVRHVDRLDSLVQFETVFWEPPDTESLRKLIFETDLVRGKRIIEIGSGTGLVSLCCLRSGAKRVVATDINPSAVANTLYNADNLGLAERLEVRLVTQADPSAYAVLKPEEKFDLIISNPPWEDGAAEQFEDNAFYDPQFALLKSLLNDFDDHLVDDGRILLAYGCVQAIRKVHEVAGERKLVCEQLDDRNLDELPNMFLPGMLLEVRRADNP